MLTMFGFSAFFITRICFEHNKYHGLLSAAVASLVLWAMLHRMITGHYLVPQLSAARAFQLLGVATFIRLMLPPIKAQIGMIKEFGWMYARWLLFLGAVLAGSLAHSG
jgi:hypothetical protein